MERLEYELEIIERHRPVLAKPETRLVKYRITEAFLAFWFRFIYLATHKLFRRPLREKAIRLCQELKDYEIRFAGFSLAGITSASLKLSDESLWIHSGH